MKLAVKFIRINLQTPTTDPARSKTRMFSLIIRLVAIALVSGCAERVTLGPGEFAPAEPAQRAIDHADSFAVGDFSLKPRAEFQITAKLLSKRRYYWDRLTPLVPWDYALGWGKVSDEAWLGGSSITQGARFMYWHLSDSPLTLKIAEPASANVHLIPASETVRVALDKAPQGAIVSLRGQLVDVLMPDGKRIPSSLSRHDTGPGACEILFVHSASVEQR